jgi:hypothetical protein
MKIHSLLFILLIGSPMASCAMENKELSDAADLNDEDAKLFAGLAAYQEWTKSNKLPSSQPPAQVVENFDDFPEPEVDEDGNIVHQLRGRLSFEEQAVLHKHVGPRKFNVTSGVIDSKLFGHQDAKPTEPAAQSKDSGPKKDASKEESK